MNNRTYRLLLGALILISLYFELDYLMYSLIVIMLLEGVTNWRIPILAQKLRGSPDAIAEKSDSLTPLHRGYRFNIEAERVWRLVVASMLLITYGLFYKQLWFFPWFMGFAIFGAGVSSVCPVLIGIKWIGYK